MSIPTRTLAPVGRKTIEGRPARYKNNHAEVEYQQTPRGALHVTVRLTEDGSVRSWVSIAPRPSVEAARMAVLAASKAMLRERRA